MAKQSAFIARLQAAQEIREQEVRHHARVYQLDMVTIALGRMGWRESRFKQFDKLLDEVSQEYAEDVLKEVKDDKDLWYFKDSMDRELKQYVGSLFSPYDERYK
jgi:hypothetical protein